MSPTRSPEADGVSDPGKAEPDFRLETEQQFPGAFRIVARTGYAPTVAEQRFVDRMTGLLAQVPTWRREDAEQDTDGILADELDYCRDQFVDTLRSWGDAFVAKPASAERDAEATNDYDETFRLEGVYRDRRARTLKIPFVVRTVPRDQNGIPTRPITDIEIATRDTKIPPEKQRFKLDVDRTSLVIRTVLLDRSRKTRPPPARLDEYLFALASIAEVGLMTHHPSQTSFAALALSGLKDEFVAREAAGVKNDYVFRLGFWGLVVVLICAACYVATGQSGIATDTVLYRFRNFFLVASGAAIGTWLSFSLRRVVLTFDDLALLEEDRLNPGLRVIFMVALTSVVGLLFWTGAVAVDIGGLSSDFTVSGSRALLIGALCGIAERAVTTAVSKRAGDFAASIGGLNQSPKT